MRVSPLLESLVFGIEISILEPFYLVYDVYVYEYTLSIITSQLHCFQLRTTLNGNYFKIFSHGLCTEKHNILLQHMHEKNFGHDLEPRFRVKAYFPHLLVKIKISFDEEGCSEEGCSEEGCSASLCIAHEKKT